jgi:hypothetical protein
MEILIGLVIVCVAGWWLFFRNNEQAETPAPYKVDTPPAPVVETKVEVTAPVVETKVEVTAPVVELVSTPVTPQITDAVTQAPAKKPRKPRAPKVVAEKPAAKKAAPVKKAAAIKAAPKKPATPRSKKA